MSWERTDAPPRPLLLAGLALLLLMGLGLLAGFGIYAVFGAEERGERHPMAGFRERAAGPVLQADPTADWEAQRAFERDALLSYGWIDAKEGIVRIPITRAMSLVLEEGLPAREEEGR